MSSRQLRKLQQQRELEQQAKLHAQAEEEESEDEPILPSKPKPSLFANLAGFEDAEEDEDEEESTEKKKDDVVPENLSDPDPTSPAAPKKPKKSKKKKKSKNKNKEKLAEEPKTEDGDDIDAALRELNLKKPPAANDSARGSVNPEYDRICALLGTTTQHLKVANEMRSLFGRTAADNHDDAGGPVGRAVRRRERARQQQVDLETALKGRHAPGKGLSELTLRRNAFIQGKEDWPKASTGGLTMEVVDDQSESDGTVEFRYVHDTAYQSLQQVFHGYVEMGDPQNLIGLLVKNPYHISLLIQVSKIAKDQTDHALSSDLLERALFTFGRAATTLFNKKLLEGKVRLDFTRPENRELWLAGYQYIKSLVMKGTYRTAFEWAKLLLSLGPEEDPYCMRFLVHHLALRAHEFNWLLDFFETELPDQWGPKDTKSGPVMSHFRPSLAFAAMQLREGAQSRKLLEDSMNTAPWLFCRLFKELNLDAPPSIWGVEPRTDAESLFTEIYIQQTKDLWNTPEATSLLMEIAHAIDKVDVASIPKTANMEMDTDVVRFVYLDNTPSLMALAPSNILHQSNNSDADPIPPEVNTYSYEAQRRALDRSINEWGGNDFFNPLAAIAGLLPRRRQGNIPIEYDDEEDAVDIPEIPDETDEELRERLGALVEDGGQHPFRFPFSLLTRMRDMLWGSGEAEEPGDEDEDEDGHADGDEDGTDTEDEMPELIEQ